VKTRFIGPVYAVQLEREAEDIANDHAINVEGLWGATIGHGLILTDRMEEKADVRVHEFYRDRDAVARSLDKLPQSGGQALGNGTTKDKLTGRSSGFLPF
jgi:Hint-domain